MRKTGEFAGWAFGLALAITTHAAAASTPETGTSPAARNFQTYQPDVRPVRIDTAAAPKIDGDLSDAAWQKAPVISEFYQLEPNEGAPATERTEVRILYDENNLYFAVKAFDSDPAGIKASIKARDGQLGKDDLIRIYLDPQQSRRDGYAFEINPLGARTDALVQNNSTFLVNWDTIWHAHSRIVSDGWVTEVAIPFRSISYDTARSDWGFDFFRLVRRKNERIRWSQISRQMSSVDISRSGSMLGISDTHHGLGLDIETFGAVRFKHEWEKPREGDLTFEPSGNLFYKLTPSLTGTLTFNTDFSDTPLDDRQVNTGRFGLFFPETRDFFLQDAAVLLPQPRPRERKARRHRGWWQGLGPARQAGTGRVARAHQWHRNHRWPDTGRGPDHATGTRPVQDRHRVHERRPDRSDRKYGSRRRLPVPQLNLV
jgi:hypothetical protein